MSAVGSWRSASTYAWLLAVGGGAVVTLVSLVAFVVDPPPVAFLTLLAASVYFAARPMVVLHHPSRVFVEVGSAFSLGALYLWGLPAGVVVQAASWVVGNAVRHKKPLPFAFNVGNLVLSIAAAWTVMALAGHPDGLQQLPTWGDAWWVPLTWLVYFVVNLGLLGLVIRSDGECEWARFREDFPWHVVSESVGFTLAPVVVALADEGVFTTVLLALPLAVISETYSVTRRAEHESLHDELTSLANRRRFLQVLGDRVGHGSAFVLLLVDLDRFKEVNDAHGHLVGDVLLVEVGRRLSHVVRSDDLVARIGGDEFAILLGERSSRDEALDVARRLHEAIVEPVRAEGRSVAVGASVGAVVVGRQDAVTVDLAIHRADQAMYAVKGRDGGVRLWDEGLEQPGTVEKPVTAPA